MCTVDRRWRYPRVLPRQLVLSPRAPCRHEQSPTRSEALPCQGFRPGLPTISDPKKTCFLVVLHKLFPTGRPHVLPTLPSLKGGVQCFPSSPNRVIPGSLPIHLSTNNSVLVILNFCLPDVSPVGNRQNSVLSNPPLPSQ